MRAGLGKSYVRDRGVCVCLTFAEQLQRALNLRLEYVQLQHMCLVSAFESTGRCLPEQWDFSCNHLLLENWKGALDCFTILREESNWSRATYT